MYRRAPPAPAARHWIWHRPLRAATLAYALATVAAAASIGIFAVLAEQSDDPSTLRDEQFAVLLAVGLVEAIVWAAVVRLSLALRSWLATALLVLASGATILPKLFVLSLGSMEGMRPSLMPRIGSLLALIADPALMASFIPVARLARRVDAGDTEDTPLDVSAAACVWAGCVALLGLVVAPSLDLGAICGLILVLSAMGLLRVYRLAREASEDDGAPARARSLVLRGAERGAAVVLLAGLGLVPLRLVEQHDTLDPAVRAVYRHASDMAHCSVRHIQGGRDGISLLQGDCGVGQGPVYGWDERSGGVLEGEALYQRLPELRPMPAAGSPRDR